MSKKRLSNVIVRVILFLLALPLIAASVLVFQEPYFPVFGVLLAVTTVLAGFESAVLFGNDRTTYPGSRITLPLVALALPVSTYLNVIGLVREPYVASIVFAVMSLVLAAQVFRTRTDSFPHIIPSITMHTMVLVYPGFFISYIVYLMALEGAATLILVLLAAVFLNDSFAYVFGRLFGRGKGGLVPISPNKSLPGFIGGLFTSPAVLVLAQNVFPDLFPGSVWRAVALGLMIGLATILGDLIESGMKRSATVKDSGTLIPGRGGILDSIDSPIFAAPVYFYLYVALFLG